MYDLNFLQAAVEKKKKSPLIGILIALTVIAVIGVSFFYVYMNLDMKATETEIAELQDYISSDEVRVKYEELNQLRTSLDGYKKKSGDLTKLDGFLLASNYMKGDVIDNIVAASPSTVEYVSIIFSGRFIDIQATADDEVDAAEWLHQIKGINMVESAEISTMSIDDTSGKASVSLSCILQEVITE